MKSIKRGRGPSLKGGILSVLVALFGVFWIIAACAMGGWFMAPFGLIFVAVSVIDAVYSFKNATRENRYSEFDITDSAEEPDPLNTRFGGGRANIDADTDRRIRSTETAANINKNNNNDKINNFCPYCGNAVEGDYAYCNNCGKKLPTSSERTEK